MRSPARAIAWELARRHRFGLAAIAGYLAVLAARRLLAAGSGGPFYLAGGGLFAAAVNVPATAALFYLVAAASFGFDGDFAARRSIYPARLFALPVSSTALALWPMLWGTAAAAATWLALARLVVWPPALDVPLGWPALWLAATAAWTQLLAWASYPFRGLRVVAAVVVLVSVEAVAIVALELRPPEWLMAAIFAPQLPLAFLAARAAVARARRGEVPDWSRALAGPGRRRASSLGRRRPFRSAAAAQAWFEWRQHGVSLPAWVALLLPFALALLFAPSETAVFVHLGLGFACLTPPVVASFVGVAGGRATRGAGAASGLSPFQATLPLTSSELVAAKLRTSIRSALLAWLVVLGAVPVALALAGRWSVVADDARWWSETIGAPRAGALALLALGYLALATWKQLLKGLVVGLGGRAGLVRAQVGATLALLTAAVLLYGLLRDRAGVRLALWNLLPWALALAALAKLAAASALVPRLARRRLVGERPLVAAAAGWTAAVLALHGVFLWFLDTPHLPHHVLLLVAIVAVPGARLAAAPLALAWNRHR